MTENHVTITMGSQEVDIILTVTEVENPDGDRIAFHDLAEGEDVKARLASIAPMLEMSAIVLRKAAEL